jgi:hypothetical protein
MEMHVSSDMIVSQHELQEVIQNGETAFHCSIPCLCEFWKLISSLYTEYRGNYISFVFAFLSGLGKANNTLILHIFLSSKTSTSYTTIYD